MIHSKSGLKDIQLARYFNKVTIERGQAYYLQGRVSDCKFNQELNSKQEYVIFGTVEGSGANNYTSMLRIGYDPKAELLAVRTANCSCPVRTFCKHSVALLLAAINHNSQDNVYEQLLFKIQEEDSAQPASISALDHLLEVLNQGSEENEKKAAVQQNFLAYVLDLGGWIPRAPKLEIKLTLTRFLKKGGYAKEKKYNPYTLTAKRASTQQDREAIAVLRARGEGDGYEDDEKIGVVFKDLNDILTALLATQRVFWQQLDQPLTLGPKKRRQETGRLMRRGISAL